MKRSLDSSTESRQLSLLTTDSSPPSQALPARTFPAPARPRARSAPQECLNVGPADPSRSVLLLSGTGGTVRDTRPQAVRMPLT